MGKEHALTQANSISQLDRPAIEEFCQHWQIQEMSLFGSILNDRFRPDSDVDFLVTFASDANWTLLDLVQMETELSEIVGRSVDIVSKRAVEQSPNWRRKERILNSAKPFITMTQLPASYELA